MEFPMTCCVMKEGTKVENGMDIGAQILDAAKCMAKEEGFLNAKVRTKSPRYISI